MTKQKPKPNPETETRILDIFEQEGKLGIAICYGNGHEKGGQVEASILLDDQSAERTIGTIIEIRGRIRRKDEP